MKTSASRAGANGTLKIYGMSSWHDSSVREFDEGEFGHVWGLIRQTYALPLQNFDRCKNCFGLKKLKPDPESLGT